MQEEMYGDKYDLEANIHNTIQRSAIWRPIIDLIT